MNAEARTQIDTLLTTLKAELAQPGRSLIPLLTSMSRFPKYSLSNQLLIYAQRPTATCVLGYRGWLKAGYQVRKGEKGLAIYAPMLFAKRRNADDPDTTDLSAAPRLGYRVAYVFDIAQVDAISGTDAAAVTATSVATGTTDANRFLEQLKAFLVGLNVELEYKALAPGLMGYTNGRRISCAIGQSAPVELATLIHETTHLLLHFPAERSTRPDLTTRETEAEAVTWLLCAQLGIAGTEASIDYIKSYRGTPDTLDASLERIRTTALRLSAEPAAIGFDMSDA